MKKFQLFLFICAALGLSACNGKTDNNTTNESNADNEQVAEALADGNTFEGANFSLVYPKELTETYSSETMFNADDKSGNYCHIDATWNDSGATISQLPEYSKNWKGMKEKDGCTVDEPVINDKILTIKAVKDGKVELHFVVMKEDRLGVTGSLKFDAGKESQYEPVLKSIIASVKFK